MMHDVLHLWVGSVQCYWSHKSRLGRWKERYSDNRTSLTHQPPPNHRYRSSDTHQPGPEGGGGRHRGKVEDRSREERKKDRGKMEVRQMKDWWREHGGRQRTEERWRKNWGQTDEIFRNNIRRRGVEEESRENLRRREERRRWKNKKMEERWSREKAEETNKGWTEDGWETLE